MAIWPAQPSPAQPDAAQAWSGPGRRGPMSFVVVSRQHYGLNLWPSTSLRHDNWPDGPFGSCQPAARWEGAAVGDDRGRRRLAGGSGRHAEVAGAGGGGARPPSRPWTRCGRRGVGALRASSRGRGGGCCGVPPVASLPAMPPCAGISGEGEEDTVDEEGTTADKQG
jgi:hypothetical protein